MCLPLRKQGQDGRKATATGGWVAVGASGVGNQGGALPKNSASQDSGTFIFRLDNIEITSSTAYPYHIHHSTTPVFCMPSFLSIDESEQLT